MSRGNKQIHNHDLRALRLARGLTQQQLADVIGTSQQAIAEIESGKRSVGKRVAHKLAEFFKVDYRLFL